MSRPPAGNRVPTRDMYWFAHGGLESSNDKCLSQRITPGEGEEDVIDSTSPTLRSTQDRKNLFDDQKSPTSLNSVGDSGNSSGPSSLETKEDRNRILEKRLAVEERRKQLWEAEQERNDAVLRKHMERDAALEARKNAQRSHISFAFGSSVPRNVESLQTGESEKTGKHSNAGGLLHREENHDTLHLRRSVSPFNYSEHIEVDGASLQPISAQSNLFSERRAFSPPCWLVGSGALIGGGDDLMSRSMTAAVPTSRGRRKNDLMPTVPYDRISAPKSSASSSTRKRSVSMTRLDQLAQPRKHYVEANKASSTTNGTTSALKNTVKSPTRPLSSASEQSGGSGLLGNSATRRVRSSPRKPRPVSIAGTIPDGKLQLEKVSPVKKTSVANRKSVEVKKASKPSTTKPSEKSKPLDKAKSPLPTSTPKAAKHPTAKQSPQPKASTPKAPAAKKAVTNKKKADIMVSNQAPAEIIANQAPESVKSSGSPPASPTPENAAAEAEPNSAKRIISEEEAKAALAEKRRLAREQAEREAELERQKQEELKRQEEERCRLEEEEHKRLEEEQLQMLEEHRKLEEEKLRKAIEDNERREEEERQKREEEQRLKAEQEKKAQEEAEKQRIELEEKLRKEEEERAERKKRLEKIMSRTRGKSSGTSPSGSVSGSDQLDSSENHQENLSSGANSLDSNSSTGEVVSEPASLEQGTEKSVHVSDGTSLEANQTFEVASDNESLNDVAMPKSETASQDNSLIIIPENTDSKVLPAESNDVVEQKAEMVEVQAADTFNTSVISNEEIKASVVEEREVELNHPVYESQADANMKNDALDQDNASVESEKLVQEEAFDLTMSPGNISDIHEDGDKSQTETKAFQGSEESAIAVNESEVLLAFEEDFKKAEINSDNSTGMIDPLLPDVSPPSEQVNHDEMEHFSRFSTSSDIKLPDPIYETSEDDSISSERHLQDYSNYNMNDQHNQESLQMADEVFNGKENTFSEEAHFEDSEKQNASPLMGAYDNQFEVSGMQESFYAYETSDVSHPAASEQHGEKEVETVGDNSSTNMQDVTEDSINEKNDVICVDENKENINSEACNQNNPFALVSDNSAYDAFADKENVELNFPGNLTSNETSMYKSDYLPEQLNLENNPIQSTESSDNSFPVQESSVFELQENENPSVLSKSPTLPSESLDFNNVTVIKAEGSDDCIGIISSVENDQVSNDFVQQSMQNELLKSHFEYSSITDSEESSLDSNLSQVMTVEVSNKNSLGLNSENEPTEVLNNVQTENPFHEATLNGSCNSKANVEHYYENEIFSNGHRTESSDQVLERNGDYVQLDGNHISSVDHSKTNIFENVSAVDFGKMSSDPFLAKGNSTQISGNPFLLQDDQKQVLMTPDFFN